MMQKLEIYCLDNSNLASFEAASKGYRSDIYVAIENNLYKLYVYDMIRLQQDFETEMNEYGFFSAEPNLILVKEVTNSNIKLTVEKLFKQKFFDYLKPLDSNGLDLTPFGA